MLMDGEKVRRKGRDGSKLRCLRYQFYGESLHKEFCGRHFSSEFAFKIPVSTNRIPSTCIKLFVDEEFGIQVVSKKTHVQG